MAFGYFSERHLTVRFCYIMIKFKSNRFSSFERHLVSSEQAFNDYPKGWFVNDEATINDFSGGCHDCLARIVFS